MQSLFGLDLTTAQKVIVASVVILVLLALLGLFVRQIQGGRLRLRGQGSGRTRQPRLGVVDTHDLDRQRQLVLIRRDNVEHLIMIGGGSDVVVETNIVRSGARAPAPAQPDLPMFDRPLPFETLVPAAEPARQEPARQEAPRQAPPRQEPPHQEPVVEGPRRGAPVGTAPETLPPLPSRATLSGAAVAAGAGLGAALGTAASSDAPGPKPSPSFTTRDPAPAPAVSAGELDDMTRQLEDALKRPFSAVRPANAPVEPLHEVAPSPVPPPVAPPKPVVAAPPVDLAPPAPPPTPFKTSSQPVPMPSDVESELAKALGLAPERIEPKAPAPAESAKPEPSKPEPLKPEPLKPEPVQPEPEAEAAPADEPEPEVTAAPDEGIAEDDLAAAPEPESAGPVTEPEPKPDLKPEPAPKPAPDMKAEQIDPFSVDAIEAEFARLLGRDPKAKS